jgi:hypothetical protein
VLAFHGGVHGIDNTGSTRWFIPVLFLVVTRHSDSTATHAGQHTWAMRPGILAASVAVSATLGLVVSTQSPPKADTRLATVLLKTTVPGWTYARGNAASESADLVKEMKSTYTGTIAATGRTWAPRSGSPQFVNISLVAYLHPPNTIQKDLRKLVPKDAWVLCRGLTSGKSSFSTTRLQSAGNGVLERCQDGSAGVVFAKANILAFIGVNDPTDPSEITRISVSQYAALPRTTFQG